MVSGLVSKDDESYNHSLLKKFLSLDAGFITPQMMSFLEQDGVLTDLLKFLTRLPKDAPEDPSYLESITSPFTASMERCSMRPDENDLEEIEATKLSYRLMTMLSTDRDSESILPFFRTKRPLIVEACLDVFRLDSRGNIYHACKILDTFMKIHPEDVIQTVGGSFKKVKRHINHLLNAVHEPPVLDLLASIICVSQTQGPMPSMQVKSNVNPKTKWKFYQALSENKFLEVVSFHIFISDYSLSHSEAAAELLLLILKRLQGEDNAVILFQPLGHCLGIPQGLIKTGLGGNNVRLGAPALKALKDILTLTIDAKIKVVLPVTDMDMKYSCHFVDNRLNGIAPAFVGEVLKHVSKLCEALTSTPMPANDIVGKTKKKKKKDKAPSDGGGSAAELEEEGPDTSKHYPGHTVVEPFSLHRLTIVQILGLLVSHSPEETLAQFPPELWNRLSVWFLLFPHNNLYQNAFHSIFYAALRANHIPSLELLLRKSKFVHLIIDHYQNGGPNSSAKGFIIKILNELRLQKDIQENTDWLWQFLVSHETWKSFLPKLIDITLTQIVKHFTIPSTRRSIDSAYGIGEPGTGMLMGGGTLLDSSLRELNAMVDEASSNSITAIEIGSDFAKELGFTETEAVAAAGNVSKKKKNKKKKKRKGEEHPLP
jgi:hypothetical protein